MEKDLQVIFASQSVASEEAGVLEVGALEALRKVEKELAHVQFIARTLRHSVAAGALDVWSRDGVDLEKDVVAFLESHCRNGVDSDRDQEMEDVTEKIQVLHHKIGNGSQHGRILCKRIDELLLKEVLKFPMRWFLNQRDGKKGSLNSRDTRHQDTRDVERDSVTIEGVTLDGSEAKYDGIIAKLVEVLRMKLDWLIVDEDEIFHASLLRFARSILNTGNRTHSGGNAYEAVMVLFGKYSSILVVPSSERAESISIEIELAEFKHSSKLRVGLLAIVKAATKYLLKDAQNLEEDLVGIEATFSQEIALPLPIARYASVFSDDNRHSVAHREQDYSSSFEPQGYVTLSRFPLDLQEESKPRMP